MHFTTAQRSPSEAAATEQDGTLSFFFWVNLSDRPMKSKPAQARASTAFSEHCSLHIESYLGLVGSL